MKSHNKFRLFFLALGSAAIIGCSDNIGDTDGEPMHSDDAPFTLGWSGNDEISKIPTTVNFGFSNGNLPAAYDITSKFPPIGDQGQYGTCVAWATAYNMKSALSGISKGLTTSDLAKASNQFSPKDMFLAIPAKERGGCDGTDFSSAFTILQDRGVAKLSTAPYTNLGNCSATPDASWTKEANENKIKYWRKIDATVQNIKTNISNNIPVVMGAKLADNFMQWNSDDVISSNTTYNITGIHGYHAMVVSGYDDNKGPRGAFKVINSWGTGWGDKGYIWIDYNFFINEFCISYDGEKPLFIGADAEGGTTPPDENPNPAPTAQGVDLAPWIFEDFNNYYDSGIPNERVIDFNIYNIGNQPAKANSNWSVYYIYFNAYDADDYGILFYDDFNNKVSPKNYACPETYNCVFNYDIPSNGDFAGQIFGTESVYRTYYMPEITGQYYLLMIADAGDKFQENNEINNFFYTSIFPTYFQKGYGLQSNNTKYDINNKAEFSANPMNDSHTTLKNGNVKNAYTTEEIKGFFKNEVDSQRFKSKIAESDARSKGLDTYKTTVKRAGSK